MKPYFPAAVFAPRSETTRPAPRVFLSPGRYIQGEGVLDGLGRYLSLVPASKAAVLLSAGGRRRFGDRLESGLSDQGIDSVFAVFEGECSLEEIDRHAGALGSEGVDCLLAVGGGKCVDAGKAIAWRLGVPVVVVPTLASNDAPCSAVSVLYTPEGVSSGAEFYPANPAMVVVDTTIVASAPERYLVAGMGDAMATWYEARVCLNNEAAVTTTGARPTLASAAIGEVCAKTLYADSVAAAKAVAENRVDAALERVVEANTLLSGLGFESGGLAGAHGIAQSYTAIRSVHDNYLHGEMVAMGTVVQLMLEGKVDEARRVAEYNATVGLPVTQAQMGLAVSSDVMKTLVEGTLAFPFVHNIPVDVTAASVGAAIRDADALGTDVVRSMGDDAFRRLRDG